MPDPIATEFGQVYEEQNLGVPLEQSLKNILVRMPNMDLKFFVTAVAIQKQAGGDMAEILDKIGYIIRERFKIMGQVQALTGEGRISGVVLMALPIALFFAVYYLNPTYIMLLFTEDTGPQNDRRRGGLADSRRDHDQENRQHQNLTDGIKILTAWPEDGPVMGFANLLPWAIFGVISFGAWARSTSSRRGPPARCERLEELRDPTLRNRDRIRARSGMGAVVEMAAPALSKALQPKTELEQSELKRRMANAGYNVADGRPALPRDQVRHDDRRRAARQRLRPHPLGSDAERLDLDRRRGRPRLLSARNRARVGEAIAAGTNLPAASRYPGPPGRLRRSRLGSRRRHASRLRRTDSIRPQS